jgi:hypothetical protein
MSGSIKKINKILTKLLHGDLNTEGLFNEVVSEGCVKWGKIQKLAEEFSTLGSTLVILISLMKMNLHYKNGSAIPKSSNIFFRFGDQTNARDVPGAIYSKTTSMVNTITEENLLATHGIIDYQKTISVKRGNLGKVAQLILNPVSFRQLQKDTFVFLHFYLRKILNLVIFDLHFSSNNMQELCGLHGGKISKKANVLGNAKNTINYISQRKYIVRWPKIKNSGQKPNLRCLRKNPLYTTRYYSFVKDEPNLSTKMVKRQLKNNNMLIWPDNKMLGIIREEVFKQQIELVHLANVCGLHSNELFKKQDLVIMN